MATYYNIILTVYQEASTISKISDPPSTGSEGNEICTSWELDVISTIYQETSTIPMINHPLTTGSEGDN